MSCSLCFVCRVISAFFVTLFAPGYLADLDTLNNSTNFLRLIFPYILLISLVAFFGAIQNSKKYFQVVAATPIIFNITLILFALSFSNLTLEVIGASILIAGALQLMLNIFIPLSLVICLPLILVLILAYYRLFLIDYCPLSLQQVYIK